MEAALTEYIPKGCVTIPLPVQGGHKSMEMSMSNTDTRQKVHSPSPVCYRAWRLYLLRYTSLLPLLLVYWGACCVLPLIFVLAFVRRFTLC